MISVTMVDANVYQVHIEGEVETSHRVSMSQEYYRDLCGAMVTHEFVVMSAMRFLLEREPNTAILAAFDLSEIPRYFPEFESEIKTRLNR